MTSNSVFFEDYRELGGFAWPWSRFTPAEMADRETGELLIVPDFMGWLQLLRNTFDQPMIITSGYRTPAHQWRLTGRRTGAHVDGVAVDVHVWGESAHKLLRLATSMGALGVGVCQKGPLEKRYLHLDRWTKAPEGSRPMLWSY